MPEVAIYPMGSIGVQGYVENNKKALFVAQLDENTLELKYIDTSKEVDALCKNQNPASPDLMSQENFYLLNDDIQELKKQGYTSDITFDEIKQYFENKNTQTEQTLSVINWNATLII